MTTVADLLLARAEDDNVALLFEGRSWSWRQVVTASQERAAWLADTVDPNRPPHVGLLLGNTPDYVFSLFGAALAGCCIVGVNTTRRGDELLRDIRHTECQFVVTDAGHRHLIPAVSEVVLTEDAPWLGSGPFAGPLPQRDALWLLIFTSGSTSAPKAVRCTQGRMANRSNLGFRATDVLYCAMPLIHGNALSSNLLPGLAGGSTIALREVFSASQWLPDVRDCGATFANMVGRALGYVLATPPGPQDRDHTLRVVLAPESSPRDTKAFTDRFGVPVISGYGQSEGAIVLMPVGKEGALGTPAPGLDIAVVDADTMEERARARFDDGGLLLNSEEAVGELVRRDGSSGFEGYWRNDEAEGDRLRNGWFWSGDLAYRDADDVFWFAGRAGDWLRVDSENFAAAPIERIISRCPGVTGVVVVGVPDAQGGDQVLAAIEGDVTPTSFAAFLDAQTDLGTKWAPRYVRVCRVLPVTANDKVDRRPIKSEAWLTTDTVWWRPPGSANYRVFTDEDRAALHEDFTQHGRAAALPGSGAPD
jgi:fatty-acyl-CoA synthase